MTFLQAIAHEEGWYKLGARPRRNNNPGDLIWGSEAQAFGGTHGDPRFAVFPDARTGWRALQRWLSVPARFDTTGKLVGGYLGATVAQVIGRFAPSNENDTGAYIASVCQNANLTPATPITPALLETPEAV